jgi:Domain of unknown function (DUF4266)
MSKYYFLLTFTLIFLMGCSKVEPWEREFLASRIMSFTPDPLQTRFRNHTYQSKEGSFGGYGVGVGSCGCN